jgi:hypothetical protein
MTGYEFQAEPTLGTLLRLDDQAYELRDVKPHIRKDGKPTRLLVWESECPSCGTGFEVVAGLKTKSLNRRCAECRRTGKPVKGKRGRRVKVEVVAP